ncbi:MAG: hypothetical protein PF489_02485 [Salinivirgaceae bacterium]|jgi:flagellar biosynthesis component FlhA|nr:hypothetical protein [Salinivirgaceae bacterium]
MKNRQHKLLIDTILIAWVVLWIYYLSLNWAIFSVALKINLGFAVITGMPFVIFFILGLVMLVVIRYSHHVYLLKELNREKDEQKNKSLLEKDIEILKLKEVLFKMQTKDMNDSSTSLKVLQDKLDSISAQMVDDKPSDEPKPDTKKPS